MISDKQLKVDALIAEVQTMEIQTLRREQAERNRQGKVLMRKLYQAIDKFEHPPSDDLWVITANLMGRLGELFYDPQEEGEEGANDD